MRQNLKSVSFLINLLMLFCQNSSAQPVNDQCSGAIDISELFTGACGDQLTTGVGNGNCD